MFPVTTIVRLVTFSRSRLLRLAGGRLAWLTVPRPQADPDEPNGPTVHQKPSVRGIIHVRWATHNDDSNAAPGSDLGIDSSGVPRHLALGHARQHVQV